MICSRSSCPNRVHRLGLCHKHYGSTDNADRGRIRADVVRDHIARLRGHGMSLDQIATAAGMTQNGLLYIIQRGVWVRRCSAAAILAVKPEIGHSRVVVDATGPRRRVAALMRMGWSQRMIAREAGLSQCRVWDALHKDVISATTAERIRQTFDRLHMTPGTNARSVKFATRQGYPPPLAWDEDAIDDPAAKPSRQAGKSKSQAELLEDIAERRDVVRRLTNYGLSASQIAERVGVTRRQVVRYRAADRGQERAS